MHGRHGVLRIAVRVDRIRVFLRHHRASHYSLNIRFHLVQKTDRLLHTHNCRRHQGAQAHEPDVLSDGCFRDGLGRYILSEVEHFKTVIFQHDLDNILADIMDIALNCGKDDPSLHFLGLSLQGLFDHVKGRLGRLRAHQQLRKENGSLLESLSDLIQRRDQFLIDQDKRLFRLKRLSGRRSRAFRHSPLYAFEQSHGTRAARVLCTASACITRAAVSACCPCSAHPHRLRRPAVSLDKAHALRIETCQRAIGTVRLHHLLVAGVHDRRRQAALQSHSQKMGINEGSSGETEGDIGYTQDRVAVQFIPHSPQCLQRRERGCGVGRDRHGETVDHYVFPRNTVSVRRLVDPAGDPHSALRVGGNAVFIQYQRDQHAAILADQRKYSLYALSFAIDGVDHGLSVVDPHASLERLRVRRIDLKRKIQHALKLLHHTRHHGRLVDLRQSHVDVEDVRAAVLLPQSFAEDIFNIVVPERLLEFLLSGGVDPLPDDHRQRSDLHALRERAHNRSSLADRFPERQLLHAFGCQTDMVRCRSAASADHMNAHCGDLFHPVGEFLRAHVIDRPAPFCTRKACIRVHDDRYAAHLREPLYDGDHLLRPESAVDAERVYAKALQKRHGRVHASAGQEFALLIEGYRDAHRKAAVLLSREHSCLGLIAVRHGLDQNKVRACLAAIAHNFAEQLHGPVKRQIAQRFQQLAGRSDVQCYIRVFAACPAPCLFGQFYRCRDDLFQVSGQFQRVGAECIGVEDIAAGAQIPAVKVNNVLRPRQVPRLRQLAALKSLRLQDRPCAAVAYQPFFS